MCGCNTNVKFSNTPKAATEEQYVVPRFKRNIRQSCDTFGNCGRIEENKFTTSEDVANGQSQSVSFTDRRTGSSPVGFPKESIVVSASGTRHTAIGLRQLAEEFASMADELDGQKTLISLAGMAKVKRTYKKRKASKGKKKA